MSKKPRKPPARKPLDKGYVPPKPPSPPRKPGDYGYVPPPPPPPPKKKKDKS